MVKAKRSTRTFHLLDVAKSLEEQNNKVGLLIQAVHAFLTTHEGIAGADLLRKAADDARAAMWPDAEDEL